MRQIPGKTRQGNLSETLIRRGFGGFEAKYAQAKIIWKKAKTECNFVCSYLSLSAAIQLWRKIANSNRFPTTKTTCIQADAKFHLERIKDKSGNPIIKNAPIRLSLHFSGNRLEYYTGVRIQNANNFNLDYWKTRKAIIAANEPQAGRKNQRLKDIKMKAELIYDQAIALGEQPTPDYIKLKLDEQFKGGKIPKERAKLVKDVFGEFLEHVKSKNSPNTWKKHNTTFNHLSSIFSKAFERLTFNQIESSFVEWTDEILDKVW